MRVGSSSSVRFFTRAPSGVQLELRQTPNSGFVRLYARASSGNTPGEYWSCGGQDALGKLADVINLFPELFEHNPSLNVGDDEPVLSTHPTSRPRSNLTGTGPSTIYGTSTILSRVPPTTTTGDASGF